MRRLPLAEALRVKRPCTKTWSELTAVGDERHCGQCDKVVRDVSALTFAEAEALVTSEETRARGLCGRIEVRVSDGAICLADGYAIPDRPLDGRKALSIAAAVASFGLAACASEPPPVVPVLVAPPPVAPPPVATPEPPKPAPLPAPTPDPNAIAAATPVDIEPEPEPAPPPVLKPAHASKPTPPPPATKGKKKDKRVELVGDMF